MLYFAFGVWMVHLDPGKHGPVGWKRSEIPKRPGSAGYDAGTWCWPLAALVYMLFEGLYAASCGSNGPRAHRRADPGCQHHARFLSPTTVLRLLF